MVALYLPSLGGGVLSTCLAWARMFCICPAWGEGGGGALYLPSLGAGLLSTCLAWGKMFCICPAWGEGGLLSICLAWGGGGVLYLPSLGRMLYICSAWGEGEVVALYLPCSWAGVVGEEVYDPGPEGDVGVADDHYPHPAPRGTGHPEGDSHQPLASHAHPPICLGSRRKRTA